MLDIAAGSCEKSARSITTLTSGRVKNVIADRLALAVASEVTRKNHSTMLLFRGGKETGDRFDF